MIGILARARSLFYCQSSLLVTSAITPMASQVVVQSSDGDSELESEVPECVNKSMSVTDVVSLLRKRGIPEQFCGAFEGINSVVCVVLRILSLKLIRCDDLVDVLWLLCIVYVSSTKLAASVGSSVGKSDA